MNIPENYEIKGVAKNSVLKWSGLMAKGYCLEFALREALAIGQKRNYVRCLLAVFKAMTKDGMTDAQILAWFDGACAGNSSQLGQDFAKSDELFIVWKEKNEAGEEIERKISFQSHFPEREGRGKSCKEFVAGF